MALCRRCDRFRLRGDRFFRKCRSRRQLFQLPHQNEPQIQVLRRTRDQCGHALRAPASVEHDQRPVCANEWRHVVALTPRRGQPKRLPRLRDAPCCNGRGSNEKAPLARGFSRRRRPAHRCGCVNTQASPPGRALDAIVDVIGVCRLPLNPFHRLVGVELFNVACPVLVHDRISDRFRQVMTLHVDGLAIGTDDRIDT